MADLAQADAEHVALGEASRLGYTKAELRKVEKCIIELQRNSRELKDCIVWLAKMGVGVGWVEVAVAVSDGSVVRVRKSRGTGATTEQRREAP